MNLRISSKVVGDKIHSEFIMGDTIESMESVGTLKLTPDQFKSIRAALVMGGQAGGIDLAGNNPV